MNCVKIIYKIIFTRDTFKIYIIIMIQKYVRQYNFLLKTVKYAFYYMSYFVFFALEITYQVQMYVHVVF